MEVLRVLKHDFGLTADDARTYDNAALRFATENGHEKVIEFFENEFGVTVEEPYDINCNCCTIT